jgi:Lipocalin-like domain
MRRLVLVFAWVCMFASARSLAEQCTGPQLGTWRLLSFTALDPETGKITAPYGLYPTGFLSYTSDCRMHAIIVREHRTAPLATVATDAEKVALFEGLIAYSGTYRIDGNTVSYHVDASWNEAWTGGTQVRQFKIDGNTLYTESPPEKSPLDGTITSATLIWTRVR